MWCLASKSKKQKWKKRHLIPSLISHKIAVVAAKSVISHAFVFIAGIKHTYSIIKEHLNITRKFDGWLPFPYKLLSFAFCADLSYQRHRFDAEK